MGRDTPPVWQQLLMTAVSLAAVGLMLWAEMPEWQRDQFRRQLRGSLARAAWASGHRAMGLEVDLGRPVGLRYGFTEVLSRLRDAAFRP